MANAVKIPTPLRPLAGGKAEVTVEDASTIEELITKLDEAHEGFKARMCDEDGELRASSTSTCTARTSASWTAWQLRSATAMRSPSCPPFPAEWPEDFPDGCILGSLSFWAACDEVLRAAVALNGWFDPAQSLSGVALAGCSARDKPPRYGCDRRCRASGGIHLLCAMLPLHRGRGLG